MNKPTGESWNYFQAQRWAAEYLKERGLDPQTPEFILKMIHDWNTTTLLMHNRDRMPSEEAVRFRRAIERVADHEPPQYVVGKAPFYQKARLRNWSSGCWTRCRKISRCVCWIWELAVA